MATLTAARRHVSPYHVALLVLFALAFARPLVENLRYPLLPGWDSWSFLGLAALIGESDGLIPAWDTLQFQPEGRPFLYPPLVPLLISGISSLSGLSAFAVIKAFTVLLYPALMVMVFVVARLAGDSRVTVASLAFLLTVNQTFLLSLSAFAQAAEILLYLLVIFSLHRRRYVLAGVAYGLTFWTHTFTPLCFGLGLVLWAVLRSEERRRVLAVAGGGVLIGVPWLLRFAANPEWIRPNTQMDQHTTLSGWVWAVAVEGFAFLVMASVLAGILLADRKLARQLYRERLPSLLACTALGLALTSYYPERSLTYMAPAVSILLAIAVFRASPAAVRRGLWLGVLALAFVAIDAFDVLGTFTAPSHLVPTLAATGLALLALHFFRAGRSLVLTLLLVLLFTDPDSHAPPVAAWADPAQVARSRLPTDAWDACTWAASHHPEALVATSDFRMTAACNYKGLRTTTGTFMEFSRDGNIGRFHGADYYIINRPGHSRDRPGLLWRRGQTSVHRATRALAPVLAASSSYDEPFGGPIGGPSRIVSTCNAFGGIPPITLHAAPRQPPGVTLDWKIMDGGGDTVSFFPVSGPLSIGVIGVGRGDQHSATRQNVKIQLTYTLRNRTEVATRSLTVLRPSKLEEVAPREFTELSPCGYRLALRYGVRDQFGDPMRIAGLPMHEDVPPICRRLYPGGPCLRDDPPPRPHTGLDPTDQLGEFPDNLRRVEDHWLKCPMDVFDEYRQAIYCAGCPVRTNRLTYGPFSVTVVEERVGPALAADLGATASALKRLGIRTLLARGAFTIPSFDALSAGTLSVTATAQTRPRPATPASARRVTIARARRSFSRAGRYRVKVKLTKQGRRALRRARRVRVRLTLAFTDRSGKTMRKAKTVSLRR